MPFFFMPLSLFTKEYISGVLTLPLILICSILIFRFFKGERNFYIHPYVACLVSVLVLIQAIINYHAGHKFIDYDSWKHFFQFIKIVILVFINYFFIRQTITTRKHIIQFLQGTFIFLGMAFLVGFMQEIYLKTGQLTGLISFIGRSLEAQWPKTSSFYQKGSYVQTIPRINGLSQEPSIFASQIGVLSFPLLLSLIKNQFNLFFKSPKKNIAFYIVVFLLTTLLSILIKSTSGLILVVLAWGFLFLIIFNNKNKKVQLTIFSTLMLALIALIFIYFGNPRIQSFLNEYLVQKLQNNSGVNRTAISLGLFKIFLHHPIFGVGFSGPYLFYATIGNVKNNPEFITFFLADKYLPQLSELGQYLANYGLIVIAPVLYYFGKIKINFLQLNRHKLTKDKLIPVINDMMTYFFIFFIISQISVIRTVNSCYLFTLFLFPTALAILKKQTALKE
ncbi:MAG: O-antigen ligase family protein [Lactobacillales bacterium]|jgi:hypothetical protein|nr:O-antigen ligase family protein [Lactobacillales bacterium]